MDDQLGAVIEVLHGMLPDECIVVALVFDDAGHAVALDLFTHHPLSHVIYRIADRTGVGRCILIGQKPHAALHAGDLRHLILLVEGVDLLPADRTFGIFSLTLVKKDRIAAVRAVSGGQLVRAHINSVAAAAVYFLSCEESGLRLGEAPAVWTLDCKFCHDKNLLYTTKGRPCAFIRKVCL